MVTRTVEVKQLECKMRGYVKRGTEILEEHVGENWRDGIDLETLNIGSCSECVLGQLFGTYDYFTGFYNPENPDELEVLAHIPQSLREALIQYGDRCDNGFAIDDSDYVDFEDACCGDAYDFLTDLWKAQVKGVDLETVTFS